MTLVTRPNASALAQNATTSRSSARSKRRTMWIGSVAESGWLKLAYSASSLSVSGIGNEYHSGMRRWLLKTLAALVLVTAAFALWAYFLGRRSLPVIDGTITVAGISAPVDIVRDADAIPHIFAATKADALFGLGYVHAQDRLWQMELQRRIGY